MGMETALEFAKTLLKSNSLAVLEYVNSHLDALTQALSRGQLVCVTPPGQKLCSSTNV